MPKLSIIVAIYNVEKWLPRCIESIFAQTFTDFELILVDDGSSDGCAGIIDHYTKCDRRIVAVRQKNRGVSSARNTGLALASGEYIGFVDADDWIDRNMYLKLITCAKSTEAELVYCNHDFVREEETVRMHNIDN